MKHEWQPIATIPPHMMRIKMRKSDGDEVVFYDAEYNAITHCYQDEKTGKPILDAEVWRYKRGFE